MLTSSFEWVVGGIGIVVAIAVGIMGFVQWRLNKSEIESLRQVLMQELSSRISNETGVLEKNIDEKVLTLQALTKTIVSEAKDEVQKYVDDKQSLLESSIYSFRNSVEGDIARSYALSLEEDGGYGSAFNWWINAAVCFSENNSDLLNVAIKGAKRCLESIKEGDVSNIDYLLERMTENSNHIKKLSTKHKNEADLIKDLMLEKAKLNKTPKDS